MSKAAAPKPGRPLAKSSSDKKRPKVSIIAITYNQEKYIRQALDGFIAQSANFDYEVIVGDDCSTDKTPEIIREYASRYPSIIKPVLRRQNMGLQQNFIDTMSRAEGEYVAICEGDDFWTDPQKIQLQADFLDANPDHAVCFHPVRVFYENREQPDSVYPETNNQKKFTVTELLKENFIQTNSVMYRKQDYTHLPDNILPFDWYLHLYHARFGKIGFINRVMSAYRRHNQGVWWGAHQGDNGEFLKKHGLKQLAFFAEVRKLYQDASQHDGIISKQINDMMGRLTEADKAHDYGLVSQAMQQQPEAVRLFLANLYNAVKNNESDIRRLYEDREQLIKAKEELDRVWQDELNKVRRSRSFRLGYGLLHPRDGIRRLVGLVVSRVRISVERANNERKTRGIKRLYAAAFRQDRPVERAEKTKAAVVVHLYYPDLWPHFSEGLGRLKGVDFDLFVTLPTQRASFEATIRREFPNAYVFTVPNHGRDVLPFLAVARIVQSGGYKYLLKLHSKKSTHRTDGREWLNDMIDKLLPDDRRRIASLIDVLERPDTGIVGPKEHYISLKVNFTPNKPGLGWVLSRVVPRNERNRLLTQPDRYGFFAGTMFWARVDAILPIVQAGFDAGDFPIERGQIDATSAHALERAFCLVPELNGKKLFEMSDEGVTQIDYHTDNIPEWSDVHPSKLAKKR